MRGYFGIGVEQLSKAMNAGTLFRTAHAFGAAFVFTVGAVYSKREVEQSDTSKSRGHVPLYEFADAAELRLPVGCDLVGVELLDDAVDLPSFRHPPAAAYILGPERGSLSPEIQALCDFTVKIPMKFCVNVGVAGAIVMYDRLLNLGRFAERPLSPGGPSRKLAPPPAFGAPLWERKRRRRHGERGSG
ncbi:MAG: RNA methyltransferase [Alphaproteobacteria bacterium]|nr:RNA methyltransferase [Candidatus Odyssella sp.]